MIQVADTLKPKNNGTFPVAEASDIVMKDGTRVEDKLSKLNSVIVTDDGTIEEGVEPVIIIDESDGAESASNSIEGAVDRYMDKITNTGELDVFSTMITGKYIAYQSGKETELSSLSCSDFVPIIPGSIVSMYYPSNYAGDLRGLAFYDADKTFVSGYKYVPVETSDKTVYFNIPRNVYYIRATYVANIAFHQSVISSIGIVNERLNELEGLSTSANPLRQIIKDGGMCRIFRKWGFIGDSLSSGEHEYKKEDGTTGFVDMYEYSFGQQVGRICNATAINFSKGGATAKSILANYSKELFETEENMCQVYVIYLGTNDFGSNSTIEAGTIDDIDTEDYNNNAETFYGYYGKIIQRIREVQPKAKIFCMSTPCYTSTVSETEGTCHKAVRTICDLFGCYFLDIYNYGEKQTSAWMAKYATGWHLNAMGYLKYAWMITTYIDYIIRNNPTDFKEIAFIGTDYHYA